MTIHVGVVAILIFAAVFVSAMTLALWRTSRYIKRISKVEVDERYEVAAGRLERLHDASREANSAMRDALETLRRGHL
jgi:hypothetical protein